MSVAQRRLSALAGVHAKREDNAVNAITLFRPVGLKELRLVMDSDFRAFPPRLPHQPIFYPVLNREYAAQIASQWNSRDEFAGYAGFITRFEVKRSYVEQFDIHQVGAAVHQELWIPADKLDVFNTMIVSYIQVIDGYYGERYTGPEPLPTILKGSVAIEQLEMLANCLPSEVSAEISVNWQVVYANYLFWCRLQPSKARMTGTQKRAILSTIRQAWDKHQPEIPLPSE
jgi:hypothetical protein